MTKRIAALDLGTNTFHLIIADVSDTGIQQVLLAKQIHVKLGEGGINKGEITNTAFKRGIDALSAFKKHIAENLVDRITAVGTAALRTATNGTAFIKEIKAKTGITIEIIEGDRESELIYKGVKQVIQFSDSSLIMDIGGGSVEFIFCDGDGIKFKKSFPVGAAKLMEMFHHSDPIAENEIWSIRDYLKPTLSELKSAADNHKPKILIGSAGAYETFAALCQLESDGITSSIVKSFNFDMNSLSKVLSDLIRSTHIERATNPAILSVRTDMIVVASILTNELIKTLKIQSVMMSTYALKEGLLIETSKLDELL